MRLAALLLLICTALVFAPERVNEAFALDREALRGGEWWRLWTGHLVHFSGAHLLGDLALLLVGGILVEREVGARVVASALVIAAALIAGGTLWLAPQLMEYRGASGLAVFLAGWATLLLWRQVPALRAVLVTVALVAVGKTLGDIGGFDRTSWTLPADVSVVWQAHLLGALAAIFADLIWKRHLTRQGTIQATPAKTAQA